MLPSRGSALDSVTAGVADHSLLSQIYNAPHVEGDGEQVLELFTRLVEKVLHELVGAHAFVRAECHHNRKYRSRTTWSTAYVWLHPI